MDAYNKLYQAAPNSALGQWAGQQAMEQQALSRPTRDKQGNPVHPHYGHPSPRVRATHDYRVTPPEYTVLPYMDALNPTGKRKPAPAAAVDAAPPLVASPAQLAGAGAAAGGGGSGPVVNMTNNTTINMNGPGSQRDARNVASEVDKSNRKALDAVKRTVK